MVRVVYLVVVSIRVLGSAVVPASNPATEETNCYQSVRLMVHLTIKTPCMLGAIPEHIAPLFLFDGD